MKIKISENVNKLLINDFKQICNFSDTSTKTELISFVQFVLNYFIVAMKLNKNK